MLNVSPTPPAENDSRRRPVPANPRRAALAHRRRWIMGSEHAPFKRLGSSICGQISINARIFGRPPVSAGESGRAPLPTVPRRSVCRFARRPLSGLPRVRERPQAFKKNRRGVTAAVVRSPRRRPGEGGRVRQGKTISTRRFCGSRTPSAVGTRGSFMPRPATTMSLRGMPNRSRATATALARRSDSR